MRNTIRSLNETTQLVRDEHKKLRGLFRQLEVLKARSPEMAVPVLDETTNEIQLYLELEQKLLFTEVHKALTRNHPAESSETEFVHQSLSDHREIVECIRRIRGLLRSGPLPFSSDWDDQIGELISLSEAYLLGEEKHLLSFVEKHLPRVDAMLSMKWFEMADEIRKRIHATSPDDPRHAQNPHGGEQARKLNREAHP